MCILFLNIIFNVDKREDPKTISQSSLKYSEEPTSRQSFTIPRRGFDHVRSLESSRLNNGAYTYDGEVAETTGTDTTPFIPNQQPRRHSRLDDVNSSTILPEHHESSDRDYLVPTRKTGGLSENSDAEDYVGYIPEHERSLLYVKYFTFWSSSDWTSGCSTDMLINTLFVRLHSHALLLIFKFFCHNSLSLHYLLRLFECLKYFNSI